MDPVIEFLKLDLLASIPQIFTYWLFVFSFLDPLPPKLVKRLAIFAIIHSIYTDLFVLALPLQLHFANSILTMLILIFVLFKELSLKKKMLIFLFGNMFAIFMELILVGSLIFVLQIPSHEDMLHEHFNQTLIVLYPLLIVTLVASWFIRKRKIVSVKRIMAQLLEGDKPHLVQVILLMVIQFLLLGWLQLLSIFPETSNRTFNIFIIYATIFVSLLALVSIIRLLLRSREQAVRMTQEVYVEDINNMFTSIRGQRHDFLNHMQVIHSMMHMGKTEQLKSYVTDLVKEAQDVSDIVQHRSPVLAAFVQAKMTVAIGKGIAFTCELPDQWSGEETSVKMIDIVKIMGNLVDNAFDESIALPIEQRHVHASISTDSNLIQLQVSNNGRTLDETEKQRIFQHGYSTKGAGHSGLGLAIVLERVKHYNGKLDVQPNPSADGTSFRITLPNHEQVAAL